MAAKRANGEGAIVVRVVDRQERAFVGRGRLEASTLDSFFERICALRLLVVMDGAA